MKCLICGRHSLPGAKLCLDCKAARKRAFDATVTQPLLAAAGVARGSAASPRLLKPSQSVPRGARRAARMALAAQAHPRPEAEAPRSRSSPWPIAIGAIFVLALIVGFFAHWFGAGPTESFTAVPTEGPATERRRARPTEPTTAPSTVAPAPAAAVLPTGPAAAKVSSTIIVAKPDVPKRPAKARVEKAPAPLPVAEPPPPSVVAVEPPPPPVVRVVPRVDPWQPMHDALARCSANDMAGRLACEHRVRTQYCEGSWGQAAQCASIPYAEHGG